MKCALLIAVPESGFLEENQGTTPVRNDGEGVNPQLLKHHLALRSQISVMNLNGPSVPLPALGPWQVSLIFSDDFRACFVFRE
jgi:hypothetical protein